MYQTQAFSIFPFQIIINTFKTLQFIQPLMSKIHPQNMKKFVHQQFQQKAVVLCQFCGGQSCPQQDFRKNTVQPNAIEGLHSNWITNQILAMQRPSDRLIKQYHLYSKFKKQKINTILNLQEPGQHPFCGDGLLAKVGFSYDPEGFFSQGILFFNQSWEDMTATTFQHMMRIMNIFFVSIIQNKGKISVHCHAGRGRTLLVICSWLIYNDRFSAEHTINLAVERRQGVLTRASQRQFLFDFEKQLKKRWKTFGPTEFKNFSEFVQKQNISLLKGEQKITENKPYLHSCIVQELRNRMQQKPMEVIDCLIGNFKWTLQDQKQQLQLKKKMDSHLLFVYQQKKAEEIDTSILVEMLYDFYDELPFRLIGVYSFEILMAESTKNNENKLNSLIDPKIIHEIGVEALVVILDLIQLVSCLVKKQLDIRKQDGEGYQKCQCLFLRIASMLSSKKKNHPKIFREEEGVRSCRLLSYSSKKRVFYLSNGIAKLADYLSSLAKDLPVEVSEMKSIWLKIRKINTNLHYYTQNQEHKKQIFSEKQMEQIYEKSRI